MFFGGELCLNSGSFIDRRVQSIGECSKFPAQLKLLRAQRTSLGINRIGIAPNGLFHRFGLQMTHHLSGELFKPMEALRQ